MRVATIVLNYKGAEVLPKCLTALFSTLRPSDQVVVVDNGNEGVLMREMKQRFPNLEVLEVSENLGFAAGMNVGLRYLQNRQFDAYWLLNNDAEPEKGAIAALEGVAERFQGRVLLSPVLYRSGREKVWFAGGKIGWWRMRVYHDQRIRNKEWYKTDFLTGCAIFIPKVAYELLGSLDERYFLYYEDVEYSLRAQRVGIPRIVVSAARVVHREVSETNNPQKTYWLVRSGVEFFLREAQGWQRLVVLVVLFLRRIKNFGNCLFCPTRVAQEVKRAYTDVSV